MTQRECSHSRRWTDQESPFVKCFPLETFGLLVPLGFGVDGVFQWRGRGGLAAECPPLLPCLRPGWGLARWDTWGTHKPRPSLRVSFLPSFSPSREPPGGSAEETAHVCDLQTSLVTSWGTVLWSPRPECSNPDHQLNRLVISCFCCLFFSKWVRQWWASPGR